MWLLFSMNLGHNGTINVLCMSSFATKISLLKCFVEIYCIWSEPQTNENRRKNGETQHLFHVYAQMFVKRFCNQIFHLACHILFDSKRTQLELADFYWQPSLASAAIAYYHYHSHCRCFAPYFPDDLQWRAVISFTEAQMCVGARGCKKLSVGVFGDIWLIINTCVSMERGQCSYYIKHALLCLCVPWPCECSNVSVPKTIWYMLTCLCMTLIII